MDRNWRRSTSRHATAAAGECLRRIRAGAGASAFGYKIQALAAHVLVSLGYGIVEVNRSGHPDIVTVKDGREFRFEVEAEAAGPRAHRLTEGDFDALIGGSDMVGYFALAVSFPRPYWVLVPASKLVRRRTPGGRALLEALCDREYSEAWTREYAALLQESCREIRRASFGHLVDAALAGRRP